MDEQQRGGFARRVVGDVAWQPPGWARAVRARPGRWLGLPVLLLGLLALGVWWLNREVPPPPDAVRISIDAPTLTDYEETPIEVTPLLLRFSSSVAPLDAIGTDGSAKAVAGVSLKPELAGRWEWLDDQQLRFTPAEDWPAGQAFRVGFDVREMFRPEVVLAQTQLDFASAPFAAQVTEAEFYQDPQDARLKRATWTLNFSHPVDRASLDRRLKLQAKDAAGRALPTPGHTLREDERGLTVWVQSEPLTLPENGGTVVLAVDAGTRSRLAGPGEAAELASAVALPALYSAALHDASLVVADNARGEPEQLLALVFNQALKDVDVADAVSAWLLPEKREPKPGEEDEARHWPVPYNWYESQVGEDVLAKAQRLPLEAMPGEQTWAEQHNFRFSAPPNRRVFLQVRKGLQSFGGFIVGKDSRQVLAVPEYPQLLRFVGEGSLLTLRGERRISIVARNQPLARLEVGRVLPAQLVQMVAANDGSFAEPSFWRVPEDALVERFDHSLRFPAQDPAKAHYEGVSLTDYFSPTRRGVFLLSLRSITEDEAKLSPQERLTRNAGDTQDRRLVVLTDLGIAAKQELDGSRQVFVQSLAGHGPVAGARVQALGRNGETLVEATTDADGRARLPDLNGFRRERAPTVLVVSAGEDFSFLPLGDYERRLDTSRFDVGGDANDLDPGRLQAFLFSDRGLYRPGEEVHLGVILRATDWSRSVQGLPLELLVTDPKGTVVKRERVAFGAQGFEEAAFTPAESAPTGPWQASLYLLGKDERRTWVGETTVQVRDFQPDTLRVRATLSQQAPNGWVQGWVRPEQLDALVHVENLFGTAAQNRRVEGRISLRPVLPSFAGWPGYRFHDPQRARDGLQEQLADVSTDADGNARIPLGLERIERASYRLDLLVRAFEPGSGRGVAATTSALVSDRPYLVGFKAGDPLEDPLDYVSRGDAREAQLVVIGPDGTALATPDLVAVQVERRYVSVLTQGDDGLYRYVSRERRDDRNSTPLAETAGVQKLKLPTDAPGDFILEIRDAAGTVLNSLAWTVAGDADLSRSLERNAELAISLSKASYAPGEEIELSIRAPYAGSGLITIERDKVIAHRWFSASTTSSVQRIRLPEGVEGNAYVSVQFLRDPASEEIFMSPLSWGIAPFAIDRDARRLAVSLEVPARSRPGRELAFDVVTGAPARVAVFAVDTGILQVAGYQVGDPLDLFLRKRMHQVDTQQILDLLLPEFSRILAAAAPGGDGEADGARHLNPFKRRGEKPAVWWSGLIDVDGRQTLRFTPPDHFNGELRFVAVAASPAQLGVAEASGQVRGDFVLTPTLPTHVAPGDVFEVPVGVANTIEGATRASQISVDLTLSGLLTREADTPPQLTLEPGNEGVATLRLKAADRPGVASVVFSASDGQHRAERRIELSIRPATPERSSLRFGRADRETPLDGLRLMFDERAQRELAASASPLVAVNGLGRWLADYPHYCTEQLVSAGIPQLIHLSHPEFGPPVMGGLDPLLGVLRTRQNAEGGFGYWTSTPEVDPFVSGYVALFLVEARERGQRIPDDLLTGATRWLAQQAADRSATDLPSLRARALAVYLLVRQGRTESNLLSSLQEQLERHQPKTWRDDVAGLLVAASYQLMQQDKPARELASRARTQANAVAEGEWEDFHSPLGAQSWRLLLLHRHFPDIAAKLDPKASSAVVEAISAGRYNTLSAALGLLALEASLGATQPPPELQLEVAGGQRAAFGEVSGALRSGSFGADAQRLWVLPQGGKPAWYALSESGFDRQAGGPIQDRGLEVQRDYLDADGRPTTTVEQGQELVVRLRLRGGNWAHIAVLDLLPGGFEAVLAPPTAAEQPVEGVAEGSGDGEGDGEHEEGDEDEAGYDCEDCEGDMSEPEPVESPTPQAPMLALPGSTLGVEHQQLREDRVVIYAYAASDMQELRYRIRAGSVGEFVIPPVFAEHMYRPEIHARGGDAGRLTVTAPKP